MERLLIGKVRERRFLYDPHDPDYKDYLKRADAWEEIGRQLSLPGETAKDTWERLRRCFLNAVNRRRVLKYGETRKMPPWKYETEMSFLMSMIDARKALKRGQCEMRLSRAERESSEPELDVQEIPENLKLMTVKQETYELEETNDDTYNSYVSNQRTADEGQSDRDLSYTSHRENSIFGDIGIDETDMFFLSMAEVTKRLPLVEQAKIKLQLSQNVLHAQIAVEEQKILPH